MPHGEAVAAGIAVAAAIAHRTGHTGRTERDRILELLASFGLPVTMPAALVDTVWDGLEHVRRIRNGALHLVLPIRPGCCVTVDEVSRTVFGQAVEDLRQWAATP